MLVFPPAELLPTVPPRHTYNATLIMVLRALAHVRAGGALLHAAEWRMYAAALAGSSVAARMAVAATVAGNDEEVRAHQGWLAGWSSIPCQAQPGVACRKLEGLMRAFQALAFGA